MAEAYQSAQRHFQLLLFVCLFGEVNCVLQCSGLSHGFNWSSFPVKQISRSPCNLRQRMNHLITLNQHNNNSNIHSYQKYFTHLKDFFLLLSSYLGLMVTAVCYYPSLNLNFYGHDKYVEVYYIGIYIYFSHKQPTEKSSEGILPVTSISSSAATRHPATESVSACVQPPLPAQPQLSAQLQQPASSEQQYSNQAARECGLCH